MAYRRQNVTFNSALVLVFGLQNKSVETHLLRELIIILLHSPRLAFKLMERGG